MASMLSLIDQEWWFGLGTKEEKEVMTALWSDHEQGAIIEDRTSGDVLTVMKMWSILENCLRVGVEGILAFVGFCSLQKCRREYWFRSC